MKNRKNNEPCQPKKCKNTQHNRQTQRANFNKNMACIINVIILYIFLVCYFPFQKGAYKCRRENRESVSVKSNLYILPLTTKNPKKKIFKQPKKSQKENLWRFV